MWVDESETPLKVIDACLALERVLDKDALGFRFSTSDDCWHIVDRDGTVVAKLNKEARYFGAPRRVPA